MFITSPQLGPHSSIDHQITGGTEGMRNRNLNILWIIPIKLSWTEKTASNIVTNSTIVALVFGEGRRRTQLGLIQPIGQVVPDAIEVITTCIVGTSLELGDFCLDEKKGVEIVKRTHL
jgi:hypothetical protein